jgi:chemotaxis protein histidine kinase CheA
VEEELAKLEQNPGDTARIGNIFRLVHTIKGTCGFLGLPRLESLAHELETGLGQIRDGTLAATPEALRPILESLEGIKAILAELEASESADAGPSALRKPRLQPIGVAWARLPRIVRDLARELGKKIELRMHGAETELDRQVLETIKGPLVHMVRNAGDHGIEPPAERVARGKPATGVITLEAFHAGGDLVVRIGDDGRGLDIAEIRRKALSIGLTTEAELARMTEKQIQQFILRPGFSTATKVTRLSGRGVGMDAVRWNLETIGGSLEIESRSGGGSVFTLKIPLRAASLAARENLLHGLSLSPARGAA